jgi:thiol:disulfide interchange protein DsbC
MQFKLNSALKFFSIAAALLLTASVHAQDLEKIKKNIEAKMGGAKIESLTKTPYAGLYEAVAEGDVFYVSADGDMAFFGNIIDLKTERNITAERGKEIAAAGFAKLPLDAAIKTVRGNGSRKVAVFTDPDCPYCKMLEKELIDVNNVTVYTFLFPLDQLHPDARNKSKAIWCSADKSKVWLDFMLKNVALKDAPANCEVPFAKIEELGKKYKVRGTPLVLFSSGEKVPGSVKKETIEKMLAGKEAE